MKLNWNGHGRTMYPIAKLHSLLSLEWNRNSGESLYVIRSYKTEPPTTVLFVRVLDDMSWQDATPSFFVKDDEIP